MDVSRKPRFATVWIGGCSGCHMSFLDLDEWLFELAELVDVVHGPLQDTKEFPTDVDITLVEGAVANADNLEMAQLVRANTKTLVSFGDCAVTGNVTALRNLDGTPDALLRRVYVDAVDSGGQIPSEAGIVPDLLPRVLPLHHTVPVDVFIPGCPPSAERIRAAILELLGMPSPGFDIRFG
jgi:NAD-reducing hydrogenase small subunit